MTAVRQTDEFGRRYDRLSPLRRTTYSDDVLVPVGGGDLAVALTGEGPPLLLLHGWTLDHRVWTPQMAELGSGHRLIMPDRRGFGRSSAPPDLSQECDDINRIADALALDRFAVAGMSQAGVIALAYAIGNPHRLDALVTLGAPLTGTVPGSDRIDHERWSNMAHTGQLAAMKAEWSQHPLMQTRTPESQALLRRIVADYRGLDFQNPSALPSISVEQLRQINVPMLALAGANDSPWRQMVARFLGNTVPAGRSHLIGDAGHLANLCQPEKFNARVTEFLIDPRNN